MISLSEISAIIHNLYLCIFHSRIHILVATCFGTMVPFPGVTVLKYLAGSCYLYCRMTIQKRKTIATAMSDFNEIYRAFRLITSIPYQNNVPPPQKLPCVLTPGVVRNLIRKKNTLLILSSPRATPHSMQTHHLTQTQY
jgi:hypothetical protein